MILKRRFPIQDFSEVPTAFGTLRVKFKDTTSFQDGLLADSVTNATRYGIEICRYTVEDIQDEHGAVVEFEDSEGKFKLELVKGVYGSQLTERTVKILIDNGLHDDIAAYWHNNIRVTPETKKKSESSPTPSEQASQSEGQAGTQTKS